MKCEKLIDKAVDKCFARFNTQATIFAEALINTLPEEILRDRKIIARIVASAMGAFVTNLLLDSKIILKEE